MASANAGSVKGRSARAFEIRSMVPFWTSPLYSFRIRLASFGLDLAADWKESALALVLVLVLTLGVEDGAFFSFLPFFLEVEVASPKPDPDDPNPLACKVTLLRTGSNRRVLVCGWWT
eukprot:CAMPEP_0194398466 /NCGR_PEP_ID=MMETSP0174-20130528/126118_1 /TAXON_ID=216777 /ORGANISM="Proboscia alata, Strain PI-D3" /LENGTH=117 /DNA_ID=CAMNT_0039194763 /DNA_START=369 /DNA_END=722 /DNA_ORIENTATION=-